MKTKIFLIIIIVVPAITTFFIQSCKKNMSNSINHSVFKDNRDGKLYNTIIIGSQTWFAQNLNYKTSNSWWYNNDSANGDIYGRLYTWKAALTACPNGWHLPSDKEWKVLEIELGLSKYEADKEDDRGTDEGAKMKSTKGWDKNGNGLNSIGFNALPGGIRRSKGTYNGLSIWGFWWSATECNRTYSWSRHLYDEYEQVFRFDSNKAVGLSVRCVKD